MLYTLEMPWGYKHPNVQYWKDQKIHVFKGSLLPAELRPFASEDFSYSRWREDEMNGLVMLPNKNPTQYKPKPHQSEAAGKIFKSYVKGDSGFIIADSTGLGKTLSSLTGITACAKKEGYTNKNKAKVLIVCPKNVIPVWRQTIQSFYQSTDYIRPMIIGYSQLNKLLEAPATARVAKKRSTKNRQTMKQGSPTVNWDFIVYDESHYLKNYGKSAVAYAASNIAQLEKKYVKGKTPYVIFSTATPGSTPLNFAIMSKIVAPLIKQNANNITPSTWAEFLIKEKFAVKKTKSGYTWATAPWFGKNSTNPTEQKKYNQALKQAQLQQRKDAQRIGKALIKPEAPFIKRSPSQLKDWPEQQIVPLPITLTSKQTPIYEEAWTRFRKWLNLTPAKSDPKGALVETLRYRQKSSILKVDSITELIENFTDQGKQVYISCEFIETIEKYKETLEKKKIPYSEISGNSKNNREEERIKFQKGITKVMLCTVVAGISLHAEESLPDGTKATKNERISIISDIRQNPNDTIQALGRAHRDGKNSITYIPYIERTVDEKIVQSFTNKNANMKSMLGSDQDDAEYMEKLFKESASKTTPPNRLS